MMIDVCYPTVGESCTEKSIERTLKFIPSFVNYNLRIWYNVIDRYDEQFAKKMLTYTDDVIIAFNKYGCTEESFFHWITSDAEFILGMLADANVHEDFFSRLYEPMKNPKVAMVGQGIKWENTFLVDKVVLVRKKAIDDVGASSPMFKRYGHANLEHHRRLIGAGWIIVAHEEIQLEDFENGIEKESTCKRFQSEVNRSGEMCGRLFANNYKGFNWWMNKY